MPPSNSAEAAQGSGSQSHMMKTTKRGRPFLKDTMDLFATLIVSLQLSTHNKFFRAFPHSFTTDEAAANLASLKFSQSNRGPDPRDQSRIVTTTTTTTFTMTRDMAKAMCQHFMDARLIENAADQTSNLFKDRGVYMMTPKGLHVLERFVSKNGINPEPLAEVFASQPICMKLLHLERRLADDEIIVSQMVITTLFRRFAGKRPNYPPESYDQLDPVAQYHQRAKGIAFHDLPERGALPLGRGGGSVHTHCFSSVAAMEWVCDFTSVVGREEAAEMAAQFVRFGFITLISDKRKNNDSAIIFTVRGPAPGGDSPISPVGEFRCTQKAIYKVTEEGTRVARWDEPDSPTSSSLDLSTIHGDEDDDKTSSTHHHHQEADGRVHRRASMVDRKATNGSVTHDDRRSKESNSDRLKCILTEPAMRSVFRDFLRSNFCEENLAFWLDVQDFKRRFNITSSAVAVNNPAPALTKAAGPRGGNLTAPGTHMTDLHQNSLVQQAFLIYSKFLAPSSPSELNIDYSLRNELSDYLSTVMTQITGKPFTGRIEMEQMRVFNATQLQNMIYLYERIQYHVFRLMATDSMPKFIETPDFVKVRRDYAHEFDSLEYEEVTNQRVGVPATSHPPGLNEDEGRAHFTVSARASELTRKKGKTSPSHASQVTLVAR